VFIWGLLGILLCGIFGPVAWIQGNTYLRTCAAMGVQPSGLGVAGRILGIASTVLTVLTILGIGATLLVAALH